MAGTLLAHRSTRHRRTSTSSPLLDQMAAQKNQKLDWRHSIVDLMKLLDLDSGLAARKDLAKELHYSGDTNNSAVMKIWLHKQVTRKLEEKGERFRRV